MERCRQFDDFPQGYPTTRNVNSSRSASPYEGACIESVDCPCCARSNAIRIAMAGAKKMGPHELGETDAPTRSAVEMKTFELANWGN